MRNVVGLEPTEIGVVHPAIDGIDHDPGTIRDLVDHADTDDLADQGHLARAALEQGHGGGPAVDAELLQDLLHVLNLSARSPSRRSLLSSSPSSAVAPG
jgi:hypothetical protein